MTWMVSLTWSNPGILICKCEILLEGGSHFENFNFCSDFREQRKLGLKVIKSFTKEIEVNKLKIPL